MIGLAVTRRSKCGLKVRGRPGRPKMLLIALLEVGAWEWLCSVCGLVAGIFMGASWWVGVSTVDCGVAC